MTINANTKIATLIKENPDALEAIISISPKFNKLKNPILRKLMASRTTVSMASKVGGCTVHDFFSKLEPLGFTIDRETIVKEETEIKEKPAFMQKITAENLVELDVRSVIESGKDPFNLIIKTTRQLQPGQVFKLINSFEPVPLIAMLGKQGYEVYAEKINDNLVHTFFYNNSASSLEEAVNSKATEGWDEIEKRFAGKTDTVDVRHLQMPLPMHTILEALDQLADDKALYVIHKRIPVFLLPELATRKFDYRIKEVSDSEVLLLIFKQ